MPDSVLTTLQRSKVHYIGLAADLRDAEHAADLIAHAKALLLRLVGELEQLAAAAECDFRSKAQRQVRLAITPTHRCSVPLDESFD